MFKTVSLKKSVVEIKDSASNINEKIKKRAREENEKERVYN